MSSFSNNGICCGKRDVDDGMDIGVVLSRSNLFTGQEEKADDGLHQSNFHHLASVCVCVCVCVWYVGLMWVWPD